MSTPEQPYNTSPVSAEALAEISSNANRNMALGASSTEFTLIFNTHGTPEDAKNSVAYVPDNSLVFIEGIGFQGNRPVFEPLIMDLNNIRLIYGKDSPEYQKEKYLMMTDCSNGLDTPVQGPNDFFHHTCMEIGSLVDKDCMVFYADHRRMDAAKYGDDVAWSNQLIDELVAIRDRTNHWVSVAIRRGVGPGIRQLRSQTRAHVFGHADREAHAVTTAMIYAGGLQNIGLPPELRRTPEGKTAAFMIFGGNHTRSLTARLMDEHQVDPRVIDVRTERGEQVPDWAYIDYVPADDSYSNFRRRVGHRIVAAATRAIMMDPEDVRQIVDEAYEPLGMFTDNGNDQAWFEFLVTGMALIRDIKDETKRPLQRYLSLMRSFMPNPEDYVLADERPPMLESGSRD